MTSKNSEGSINKISFIFVILVFVGFLAILSIYVNQKSVNDYPLYVGPVLAQEEV